MKTDILSMNPAELRDLMKTINQPAYRADQVFEWLHRRNVYTFAEMDNLPVPLRTALNNQCEISSCRIKDEVVSQNDGTHKFLFSLNDGVLIESVRMKYKHGYSICISTQAGCKMGCRFCASAENGFLRNLTAGEMCAQVYAASAVKPSNIVLMGSGEPLDNFDETVKFLELINHTKGAAVGSRHITISTCGLIPQIKMLADMKLQINLAVSLHAVDDDLRKELIPAAKNHPISELINACRYYIKLTNRRITFEYALIEELNDNRSHAAALAKLLGGMLCHVNLIPVNEYNKLKPPPRLAAQKFAEVLEQKSIPVTIRRTIGSDVNAACGQLTAKREENND